jgi:hypothetical protein
MTNLDPQTTADFWDAYVRAAGGGATCDPPPTSRSTGFTDRA